MQQARVGAGWVPDTSKAPRERACPEIGYVEAQCTPVILLPGAHLGAPGIAMEGRGFVWAQYVVDERGRADMKTLDIIYSDHRLLTDVVRRGLPSVRFMAATRHIYQRARTGM